MSCLLLFCGKFVTLISRGVCGADTTNPQFVQQSGSQEWHARWCHRTVVLPGGKLVLLGGARRSASVTVYLNDVYQSTDDGKTWTLVGTAQWSQRGCFGAVVVPGTDHILVVGGRGDGGRLRDVWKSTDHGASFEVVVADAPWLARSPPVVAVPNGPIVVVGGRGAGTLAYTDVWATSDSGGTWSRMVLEAPWPARVFQAVVALASGSIVVCGGRSASAANSLFNDVWVSHDFGATWLNATAAAWQPRYGHMAAALPDGSMVVLGGATNTEGLNDLWRGYPTTPTGQHWEWALLGSESSWSERNFASVDVLPDRSLVLVGGLLHAEDTGGSDVWRATAVATQPRWGASQCDMSARGMCRALHAAATVTVSLPRQASGVQPPNAQTHLPVSRIYSPPVPTVTLLGGGVAPGGLPFVAGNTLRFRVSFSHAVSGLQPSHFSVSPAHWGIARMLDGDGDEYTLTLTVDIATTCGLTASIADPAWLSTFDTPADVVVADGVATVPSSAFVSTAAPVFGPVRVTTRARLYGGTSGSGGSAACLSLRVYGDSEADFAVSSQHQRGVVARVMPGSPAVFNVANTQETGASLGEAVEATARGWFDPAVWHTYEVVVSPGNETTLTVDGVTVLTTQAPSRWQWGTVGLTPCSTGNAGGSIGVEVSALHVAHTCGGAVSVGLGSEQPGVSPPNAGTTLPTVVRYSPPTPMIELAAGQPSPVSDEAFAVAAVFDAPVPALSPGDFTASVGAPLVASPLSVTGSGRFFEVVVDVSGHATAGSSLCPPGYTSILSAQPLASPTCFKAIHQVGTWKEQNEACGPFALATITSEEELRFVSSLRASGFDKYWYVAAATPAAVPRVRVVLMCCPNLQDRPVSPVERGSSVGGRYTSVGCSVCALGRCHYLVAGYMYCAHAFRVRGDAAWVPEVLGSTAVWGHCCASKRTHHRDGGHSQRLGL